MAVRNTAQCDVCMLIVLSILSCRGDEYTSLPTSPVLELQMKNEAKLETQTTVVTDTEEKFHGGETVMPWNPATARTLTDSRIDPLDYSKKDISKQNLVKHHRTPDVHVAGLPCNFPDSNMLPLDRKRRFAVAGKGRWLKTDVTYHIQNFATQLSRKQTRLAIRTAFDTWQRESTLSFTEVFDGDADIILLFTTGDHGDGEAFNELIPGHGFYPAYGGDVHFNDDISWTVGANGTYDLAIVAAHEIGHSLGLAHTPDKNAIMNAEYAAKITYPPHLGQDDIDGIHALYGEPPRPAEDKQTSIPQTLVIIGVVAGCGSFVLIVTVMGVLAIRRRKCQRSRRHQPNNSTDQLQDQSIPRSPVPSCTSIYLQMSEMQNQRSGSAPHHSHPYPYIPENNRSGNQLFLRTTSSVTDAPYEQLNFDQVSGLGSYCEIPDNVSYQFSYDYAVTQEVEIAGEKLERSDSNRTYKTSRSPARGGADSYIKVLEEKENDEVPKQ